MPIQQSGDENPLSQSRTSTAGVVQSLRGDPTGRYVFLVNGNENGLVYRVRANTRAEAWTKLREYKYNGTYVDTSTCTIQDRIAACEGDPQVSMSPKGREPE